ncbi:MAG: nuclear transport factor 2 family protein [Dehalococcoidia bacterium]|nr:nuclear transport factor 2 family protein [Dehalococcoidia bacterium]
MDNPLDRLLSLDQIRQLASRYAHAVDSRDLHSLAALFVDDVSLGAGGTGRDALKRNFDTRLRRFTTTIHFVCNHIIDFDSADRAHGLVYTRAEHEMESKWIVLALQYQDTYERRAGQWFFVRRKPLPWYASDMLERPTGPRKIRWPDMPHADAPVPAAYPSWAAFWDVQGT